MSDPQNVRDAALAAKGETPKWLTIRVCAEQKSVHPNTIRNAIKAGKLPAVRFGRNIIRINQADLDALFTSYKGGEFGLWSTR